MEQSTIRIMLEEQIGKEIYDLLEGDLIEEILKKSKVEKNENEHKSMLEGHSFRVTEKMVPALWKLFNEVKQALDFKENVDLYVTNNPEVNAYCVAKLDDDDTHLVNVNSGLIEKLDDDELKFVLGHELGHLISKNADISRIIHFIFPKGQQIPYVLYYKIKLWEKLSELTADRFGFIASPKLEKVVSGFFKLASGMDLHRLNFDFQEYLIENDKILDYFRTNISTNVLTHPVNPIRIKSIQLFNESSLYRNVMNNNTHEKDNLEEKLNDLISILTIVSNTELDQFRQYFIATAGIILGRVDEKINEDEIKSILNRLSIFCMYPEAFLMNIIASGKVEEMFSESVQKMLDLDPSEKYPMFDFCVDLVISDRKLNREEIDILFSIGIKMFGFSEKETAQLISQKMKQSFYPSLYSVKPILSVINQQYLKKE